MHGTDEIACGYEKSRKSAQNVGDALFQRLSTPKK
jgi:hypothetical protein